MRQIRAQGATAGQGPRRLDPAPSRWAYRMQRLWLTPGWRAFLRYGAPSLALVMVLALVAGQPALRGMVVTAYEDIAAKFQNRPEFIVEHLSIEGAVPDLASAVRVRLGVQLPLSSFDIDLAALRAKAEELDAVKSAEVAIRKGGVLEVLIEERVPSLVWRDGETLHLLDDQGHRVAGLISRGDRDDLPLIAGPGADLAAAEALALLDAATPIAPRLRGLIRMGERRWDMVLDQDLRILLPADAPIAALERLLALDAAEAILTRDLAAVDMRQEARPILRLSPQAMARAAGRNEQTDATSEQDL